MLWTLLFSLYCVVKTYGQQLIDCSKTGPCSCSSAEGVIDLSPLDSMNSFSSRFSANSTNHDTFYYNPCSPFSLSDSKCRNAAVCQLEKGEYHVIGTQDTADFKQLDDKGLHLIYTADVRTSYVQLLCDQSLSEPEFTASGEDPDLPEKYHMSLKSKYACPIAVPAPTGGGGLSTGSILCIFATGIELIPNVNFWKEFPFLVKDGVVFTVNGFKTKVIKYDSL